MHHHLCFQMLAYLVELSPVVFVLLVAVYVTVDRYLYRYLTISIIRIQYLQYLHLKQLRARHGGPAAERAQVAAARLGAGEHRDGGQQYRLRH